MISPTDINSYWPHLCDITYLNTASTGLLSSPVVESIHSVAKKRSMGAWGNENTAALYDETKERLAGLLGGSPDQYAFVPSTSLGINLFGHAISYEQDSNIVVCDLEFPSNYIPWQNICRKYGLDLRVVESTDGAAHVDAFESMIDENTRVVAVSHVQFGSGFRSNLKELASIIHRYDGYLVADIIQSVGWADFNLKDMDVDFAAGQATKWIAGPIGAGYAYVREEILSELNPIAPGWRSVKDHRNFEYYDRVLADNATMFEGGSVPLVAYIGLSKALDIIGEFGISSIEHKSMENSDYLKQRLLESDIDFYNFGDSHNSPIVSCVPKSLDNLEAKLKKDRIYCSIRNGRLRISPHFYNSFEDVDRLMERLG